MISLKKLLTEDSKVKIYVQKGKKPPKGKTLKKGPKGGQYFIGTPKEKTSYEGGKTKSAPKKKVNIFNKPKKKVVAKKTDKATSNLINRGFDEIKKEYEKVSKEAGNYGAEEKLDYLKKLFPKIKEDDLEEALFIQQTFANAPPEDYSEMQAASKQSKWFDKFMKKHPELEKIGFDEGVVYDPKDDF
jgi:hypothetical protein